MPRIFARPIWLAIFLLIATFIPIIAAILTMYQIAAGSLPKSSIKFAAVPGPLFFHALGGVLFGLLGPLQFAGVLKRRFGRLHKITGRIFVASGLLLGLSSLRLLAEFPDASTWVLISARLAAGLGMSLALIWAIVAIRRGQVARHRAWMIRAYAVGMGSATISFIMLPIFLITGEAVEGYAADLLFVASWVINITIAELVVRRAKPVAIKRLGRSEPPLPLPRLPSSLR
jgi:uncharacterized membrane protein